MDAGGASPVSQSSCNCGMCFSTACHILCLLHSTVFFYNFYWQDMTVPSLELMMRVVQVISFTVNDKRRKVSVHCHAGLGT
jgi:hypothetical protein